MTSLAELSAASGSLIFLSEFLVTPVRMNMLDVYMSPPSEEPEYVGCCGDPKNLNGNMHPWRLVTEDGPGDVYVCAECGAVDVD